MALLWFDGFESYSNAADLIAVKNPVLSSLGNVNNGIGSYGRNGGRAVNLGGGHYYTMTLVNNYSTLIMGAAFYCSPTIPYYNSYYSYLCIF